MGVMKDMPVLTAVECDGDNLVLRFDLNTRAGSNPEARIVVLNLKRCSDLEAATRELVEAVAESVEYDGYASGVSFTVDYGRKEFEVECESWSEVNAEPTMADLYVRSRYFAAKLDQYATLYHEESTRFTRLVRALEREVETQVDRAKRKQSFFRGTNAAMADVMEAEIGVYERVAKIMRASR